MYENITKDGVYRISLSRENPYARYLVVKTYGSKQKKKRMCSLEECEQQVKEWDDDYSKKDPKFNYKGFKILFPNYRGKKETSRPARNYYSVYDSRGALYMQGFGDEIAERFGCKSKTVCNCANSDGRRLTMLAEGKKLLFDVLKIDQPQKDDWIIDPGLTW